MTEKNAYIYSIGHGGRKIEDFINLLNIYEIKYVVDVRSKPRSRFHPQFNQKKLHELLNQNGIGYLFLGDKLGGLPSEPSCYDEKGHVVYNKVKGMSFYEEGLARLTSANEKKIKIACMCSEIDPCDCHRSKLIGSSLSEQNIPMLHINKLGHIEDQETVIKHVINSTLGNDLFSDESSLKSRNSYR
ncbi:DUF488 family protein [Pseudomonas aeruginosa]|uniref:DUF488 domain-containing protein n=1 Tax=Pseudomonas aeruginosa TaxID=287 RepID=UPI000995535E|nr:DUF488 domain-containing protein [Pseudomonas aeruginosa]MBH4156102.1 DUF488 domain-containing protein [Pseudomonas aeruginosa]MBH9372698.1 DUF488 domain-containing protein [Pseudomonas aeruginosa]MBI8698467.1 DUF488 domain-containing protein [Pseudomonas aeruginosa]MBP8327091.1 DUF488 domain-containing protein [Pseudomonas aeruginosa]